MKYRLLMSVAVLAVVLAVLFATDFGSLREEPQNKVVAKDTATGLPAPPPGAAGQLASNAMLNSTAVVATGAKKPDVPATTPLIPEANLWQIPAQQGDTTFDGVPAKRLLADPGLVAGVHTGQKLLLSMPHSNSTLEALIDSTHNLTPSTQVWQGKILHGHPQDNITITRGKIETHITIATFEGTYSAVIDNTTGSAIMVDEADLHANQLPHEDGIAIEPLEHHPPAL